MSDSKPSGTVCRHCTICNMPEAYWRHHIEDTQNYHPFTPEPAPAEQLHCQECGEVITFNGAYNQWFHADGTSTYPKCTRSKPVEQPCPEPNSLSMQKRKHVMSGGKMSDFKPVPVAASPAEGPQRNMTNEQLVYVAMAVTETETRALYRAEILRRMSAAQPVPGAKVDEIAEQCASVRYRLAMSASHKEIVAAIAAILRPFFPANAPQSIHNFRLADYVGSKEVPQPVIFDPHHEGEATQHFEVTPEIAAKGKFISAPVDYYLEYQKVVADCVRVKEAWERAEAERLVAEAQLKSAQEALSKEYPLTVLWYEIMRGELSEVIPKLPGGGSEHKIAMAELRMAEKMLAALSGPAQSSEAGEEKKGLIG